MSPPYKLRITRHESRFTLPGDFGMSKDAEHGPAIRVLIADDHPVVREGLRGLITSEPGMEVVGEAADGFEAVEKARSLQPDVILLDLMMPRMSGLEAIGEIKRENPEARILVITSFAEDNKVFPAIKTGALGYLLKDSSPQQLLQAIREVSRGESSLHPTIARKLIREISRPSDLPPAEEPLTAREVEVLQLVATGLSNQEIAENLVVSERTVRNHVSNILTKLHLANRTQAALYALREGLASLDTKL
jgi:NarL family two-component system response regulator LiaR